MAALAARARGTQYYRFELEGGSVDKIGEIGIDGWWDLGP